MFPSWTSVHYKVRLCQKFNRKTPLTDQDFSHETILNLTDGKQLNLTQMFEKTNGFRSSEVVSSIWAIWARWAFFYVRYRVLL